MRQRAHFGGEDQKTSALEQHTNDVEGRKVGRGAGRGAALPVEQRLGVKGEAPGERVDPAKEGGQQGQECGHGLFVLFLCPCCLLLTFAV